MANKNLPKKLKAIEPKIEYMTVDELSKLKDCPYNRELDPNNVKKILKSMRENGYDQTKPILIDRKTRYKVDGNHRVAAVLLYAKETNNPNLKVPVFVYEWKTETDIHDYIVNMNDSSKGWTIYDYIHIHRDSNKVYEIFDELAMSDPILFCLKDKSGNIVTRSDGKPSVKYNTVMDAMNIGRNRSRIINNTFSITHEDIERFYKTQKEMTEIIERIGWTKTHVAHQRYDTFVKAYHRFKKAGLMSFEQIIKTISKKKKLRDSLAMYHPSTAGAYNIWFDMIYREFAKR